jgi:hypothetical protein
MLNPEFDQNNASYPISNTTYKRDPFFSLMVYFSAFQDTIDPGQLDQR